jgi:hypothetical protein
MVRIRTLGNLHWSLFANSICIIPSDSGLFHFKRSGLRKREAEEVSLPLGRSSLIHKKYIKLVLSILVEKISLKILTTA